MGDDGTSCSWWILNFLLFSAIWGQNSLILRHKESFRQLAQPAQPAQPSQPSPARRPVFYIFSKYPAQSAQPAQPIDRYLYFFKISTSPTIRRQSRLHFSVLIEESARKFLFMRSRISPDIRNSEIFETSEISGISGIISRISEIPPSTFL